MTRRLTVPLAALGVMLATVVGLLQTAPVTPGTLTRVIPGGAVLVVQAKDLSSLVRDWNGSAQKATWLQSANYQAFARSRLFLRLEEAYGEFSTAAGVPPDMALVSEVAGGESALAIYDIGNLEFLYVTRLPAARAIENALWRQRGTYEPRTAAGQTFYVRTDPESKRVVAFGTRDDYLLLATREDLLAGALARIGAQGQPSVEGDGWFARATAAAGPMGELRLVMNLDALTRQPHFRSYWIHRNVDELRAFASGVSDLTRTPTEIREQRLLIRAVEQPAPAATADALSGVIRLVPDTAGLYRAWTAPSGENARRLIMNEVIGTSGAVPGRPRTAPGVALSADVDGGVGGGEDDFESRIDEDVRVPLPTGYQTAALDALVGAEPLTAMLHVESTRPGADGVFVGRGSVIVLARSTAWPPGAAADALQRAIEPVWTKSGLGLRWMATRIRAEAFSQLDGLEPLALAERGSLLFVANDAELLARVLESASRPAVAVDGGYAAGFRHAQERDRFGSMMRFIDRAAGSADGPEPPFFSGNLAGLSETLARVGAASIVARDTGAGVSQTVIYRLTP
jgi:hypothetical protein